MANYAIAKWNAQYGSMTDALAGMETQLETLDSTNDPIVKIGIEVQGALFHAFIVTS